MKKGRYVVFVMIAVFMCRMSLHVEAQENQTCSVAVYYRDADTDDIVYIEIVSEVEQGESYSYEPPYVFRTEKGNAYILDTQNAGNEFYILHIGNAESENRITAYYKKGELPENETAVKVRCMAYDEQKGDSCLMGLYYIENLRVGDSYRYQPEGSYQPGYGFPWAVYGFKFEEENADNRLTIDSLQADSEKNTVVVYYKEAYWHWQIRPADVYCVDSVTGETITILTAKAFIQDGGVVSYEPETSLVMEDGSRYEFDRENKKNVLYREDYGNILAYYRRVFTVRLDANGGICAENSRKVREGMEYGTLPVPVREGYVFDGWYTAAEGGERILASAKVSQNANAVQTLYARWSKIKVKRSELKKVVNLRGRKIKITWKKVLGAEGYQIVYAEHKRFQKVRKKAAVKNSLILRKLKKGKTYYVKVRAYKLDSAGKKVYGAYSKAGKAEIRK